MFFGCKIFAGKSEFFNIFYFTNHDDLNFMIIHFFFPIPYLTTVLLSIFLRSYAIIPSNIFNVHIEVEDLNLIRTIILFKSLKIRFQWVHFPM